MATALFVVPRSMPQIEHRIDAGAERRETGARERSARAGDVDERRGRRAVRGDGARGREHRASRVGAGTARADEASAATVARNNRG